VLPPTVAYALIAAGWVAFGIGYVAQRRHGRAFDDHIRRLKQADGIQAHAAEVERFAEDDRVDRYTRLMVWGNMGGIGLIAAGGFVLILS